MKGTIPLDAIDAAALADYAGIVGHLLAKGHARTSGASMIAGYAGASDKLDRALARFARAYADQTEADHARLVKAVRRRPAAGAGRCAGADRAQPSGRADRRRQEENSTADADHQEPGNGRPDHAGRVRWFDTGLRRRARAELRWGGRARGPAAGVGQQRPVRGVPPSTRNGPDPLRSSPHAPSWDAVCTRCSAYALPL